MMKVLIVDDHALVRDALARVLASLVPDLIVFEAGEPELAFRTLEREADLELVLLDLSLPGMHGLTALRSMRASHPAVAVVVVSATSDRASVAQVLDDGAMGFIPKSSSNEVLKNAFAPGARRQHLPAAGDPRPRSPPPRSMRRRGSTGAACRHRVSPPRQTRDPRAADGRAHPTSGSAANSSSRIHGEEPGHRRS